jgi:hypothetical protein
LKALKVSEILGKSGHTLTPKQILTLRTVEQCAEVLKTAKTDTSFYPQEEMVGEVPLLTTQRRFFEKNYKENSHFSVGRLTCSAGQMELNYLENSIIRVLTHHDALRSVFDQKVWMIRPAAAEGLYELTSHKTDSIDFIAANMNKISRSFSIASGPLFKLAVYQGQDQYLIFWACHRLISDESALDLIIEDVTHTYESISKGEEVLMPQKTASVRQASEYLEQYSKTEVLSNQLDYWYNTKAKGTTLHIGESGPMVFFKTKTFLAPFASLEDGPYAHKDYLLAGLVNTLCKFKSVPYLPVMIGSDYRSVIRGIDLTRTVGFLTYSYPVILSSHENPLESLRQTTKVLTSVPDGGIGYEVLVSTTHPELAFSPAFTFRYFGTCEKLPEVIIADLISPFNRLDTPLIVDARSDHTKTCFTFTYDAGLYSDGEVELLYETFLRNLKYLMSGPSDKQNLGMTKGSVSNNNELKEIFDIFG